MQRAVCVNRARLTDDPSYKVCMTPKIVLIVSPFHVGLHRHRVGKGPERILAKLQPVLVSKGISHRVVTIDKVDDYEGEIGRSFEVLRRIAEETKTAVDQDEFPLILAGNCHSSAAVAAGLNAAGLDLDKVDVFWTDAHADAQIPDDNSNGYFDSMGSAMLAGMCWKYHMSTLNQHTPIPFSNITFIGIRDMEESEKERIVDNGAKCIFGGTDGFDYPAALSNRLDEQQSPDHRSLVHFDLDSLDPTVGHANDYPVPGGLLEKDLIGILELLSKRNPTSLTIASFGPDLQNGGHIVDLAVKGAVRFIELL